jgi:hypothetical protein
MKTDCSLKEEEGSEMETDFKFGKDESESVKYFEFSEGDVIGVYFFPFESKFSFSINGNKKKSFGFHKPHEALKFACILYNKDDSISVKSANEFSFQFAQDSKLIEDKAVEFSKSNLSVKKTLKQSIYTTILSQELISRSLTRFYK